MINSIVIMGRLVAAPELKVAGKDAIPICTFTLAYDKEKADKDGNKTNFVQVTAWKKTAEHIATYFRKGQLIIIQGKLDINTWTDDNGHKRENARITADKVSFAGDKPQQKPNAYIDDKSTERYDEDDDFTELPF